MFEFYFKKQRNIEMKIITKSTYQVINDFNVTFYIHPDLHLPSIHPVQHPPVKFDFLTKNICIG